MHTLAGIISPGYILPPEQSAKRMFDAMSHPPAVRPGFSHFDQSGVQVGWLTSAQTTPASAPGWSDSRRVAVIFVGEEFSAEKSSGASTTAAAMLANNYERFGAQTLLDLNGWFSGVIIDLRDYSTVLFNDRYGRGRVYFHRTSIGFFFASEAKALLGVLPQLRELDQRALAEWFAVGCVLQDRSLFRDIELLPPGSIWIFKRDGRIARQRYFDPGAWEQQSPLSTGGYIEQLREIFSRIAPRYARGAAPVAMSLTGGLDSRAVLAWSGAAEGALPCYTFAGPYRDCADVVIARRLAEIRRHAHTTIRIGPDFFRQFSTLAARTVHLSDGTMDVSGAVELHVNELARDIAPVRLTGNYGSEILRSHLAFRPARLDRSLFTPEFAGLLDTAEDTYRSESSGHRLSFIAFKQVPWHHHGRFAVEKSQLTPRSPFLDNELVALAYRAPSHLATSAQPLLDLIAGGDPQLAAIDTDRGLAQRSRPVVSRIARAWHEFTAKAEYAADYGMPRWLACASRPFAKLNWERLFLGRHKFYHFRLWYRHQLAESVRAQAAADTGGVESCYRAGASQRLVAEHLSGRANRTLDLHRLLSIRLINRHLLRAS